MTSTLTDRAGTSATLTDPRSSVPPLRRASGWFSLGLAVIAAHVLDDRFIQPSPGTSAADHLVSGLVPLAALALAAWAYSRVRAGQRGAIALLTGTFGIVAGIEAVHYTTKVGRPATTTPACSPSRPGSCCSDWAPSRCGGPAARTAAASRATCAERYSRSEPSSSPSSSSLP